MESKNLLITGLVVAAIVIGGVVLWMNNDSSEEADTANNNTTQQVEQEQPAVEEQQDIVALAAATPDLSTLVTAVQAAELVETLQGDGPFTVFAPTNDAFAALPDGTLDTLLEPANIADLQGVLTYHVVAAEAFSTDLSDGQVIETVNGGTLTVSIRDGGVYIVDANGGEAQVVTADVDASNGVVHVIDSVLLP